jgi:hypothetical protein
MLSLPIVLYKAAFFTDTSLLNKPFQDVDVKGVM